MGSGSWDTRSFASYTTTTKGVTMDSFVSSTSYKAQDIYKAKGLSSVLDPKNVMRECRDSDEHPHTLPVILALDVTGSMGGASVKVAQKLNEIMTDLYADESIKDIEFCIMGIGDLYCDIAPIQISQFESDIRIAEQLDEIYFEGHGGGNDYESYTAAWYMGIRHCDLDCWKRGEKGIIITMGDELPNPYLPKNGRYSGLAETTGDSIQDDIPTDTLLEQTLPKYDVYHISIDDPQTSYHWNNRGDALDKAWTALLGEEHYSVAGLNNLASRIVNIISSREANTVTEEVSW